MNQEEIGGFNESFERYKDRIANFSNEFEFGLFMHILKKSLPVVLTVLLTTALAAFLYLRYTIPVYEAKSSLQIGKSDKAKMVLGVENFMESDNLESDLELMRSNFLLEKSMRKLNLPVRYFAEGKVRSRERYKNSEYEVEVIEITDSLAVLDSRYGIDFDSSGKFIIQSKGQEFGPFSTTERVDLEGVSFRVLINHELFSYDQDNGLNLYFKISSIPGMIEEFKSQLRIIVLNGNAQTVEISYKNSNALLARDLVSNHAMTFLEFHQSQKELGSRKILEFIDNQLDTVSENLRNAEFLLNSFKQKHKVSMIEHISDSYLNRLNELEEGIFKLENEEKTLNYLISYSDTDFENIDIYSLIATIVGTRFENSLQDMLTEMAELLRKKEEKFYEVTPSSEYIKSLDYRIDIQKKLIVQSLESLITKNQFELESLRSRNRLLENDFAGLPTQELEYARYQRLYSINERYYSTLLEKKIEYNISKAGISPTNKILLAAVVPKSPINPNRTIAYTGFAILGLVLSLLFVIIRYLLHDNITSLNEIAKLSNCSIGVLGIIPKFKEDIPVSQLIIDKKPKSLIAESFRSIRTNMEFLGDVQGPKVVAVTSTISAEGKTFVALNLAGIIALSGKKVVILDLDMRRPKIHRGFGVDNDRGMSTMLINKHQFSDCIRHSSLENLDYVTAGPIAPNPSELMISPRMTELIEQAKTMYDVVVIDNPPVGLVTDGIASIKMADYPIYIFRADYSKKHFVQNVDRLINENGIRKMSVILNGVDIERNKYGSYYGYGYGYGYGYAYESGYGSSGYYDSDKSTASLWTKIKKQLWK